MKYRYYAIRDACAHITADACEHISNRSYRKRMMYDQPIKEIMKTPWHRGYGAGVYEYPMDTFIHLSHIDEWDYDILFAFGVPEVNWDYFDLDKQRIMELG